MESYDFPIRAKKPQAETDRAFAAVLDAMLESDDTITARSVAAKLRGNGFGHASSITRDPWRTTVLQKAQADQEERRRWKAKTDKKSKQSLENDLLESKRRISELEAERNLLLAAHLGFLQALGESQGLKSWNRFFGKHQELVAKLRKISALPSASVTALHSPTGRGAP